MERENGVDQSYGSKEEDLRRGPTIAEVGEVVQPDRKEQTIELLVFLFLIIPSMTFSFFVGGMTDGGNFALLAVATILRDLALVCLVVFFAWRNREPLSLLGWSGEGVGREAALGTALFVPMFFLAAAVENLLRAAGLSAPAAPPGFALSTGIGQSLLALILVVVVAFSEETIFRGYLILRLKAITSSPLAAALLSAGIFSLGHGYEGTAGAMTVAVLGVVFAAIYLWRKSLVAPMVMHFFQNFIGIVLVPILGAG